MRPTLYILCFVLIIFVIVCFVYHFKPYDRHKKHKQRTDSLLTSSAYIDDLKNTINNTPCNIIGTKQTSFATAIDMCIKTSACQRVVSSIDSKNTVSYNMCSNSIDAVCLDNKTCCATCESSTLPGATAQFIKSGNYSGCTPITGSTGDVLFYISATAALNGANVYNKAALLNKQPLCQSITTREINNRTFFILCLNSSSRCNTECSATCPACSNEISGPVSDTTGTSTGTSTDTPTDTSTDTPTNTSTDTPTDTSTDTSTGPVGTLTDTPTMGTDTTKPDTGGDTGMDTDGMDTDGMLSGPDNAPPIPATPTVSYLAHNLAIPETVVNVTQICPPDTINALKTIRSINTNRPTVTLFEDNNYTGAFVEVYAGRYTYSDTVDVDSKNIMGLATSELQDIHRYTVSSVKINPGMQVTLFSEPDFSGRQIVLKEDTACLLQHDFDDIMQSFIVGVNTTYEKLTSDILAAEYLICDKTIPNGDIYYNVRNTGSLYLNTSLTKTISNPSELVFLFYVNCPWQYDSFRITMFSKDISVEPSEDVYDLMQFTINYNNAYDVSMVFSMGSDTIQKYQSNVKVTIPDKAYRCKYIYRILANKVIMSYQCNNMYEPNIQTFVFDGLRPPSINALMAILNNVNLSTVGADLNIFKLQVYAK